MPYFVVNTNVPKSKFPADFKKQVASVVAKKLNLPDDYVGVQVNAGSDVMVHSTEDPACWCDLSYIKGPAEQNAPAAKEIVAYLSTTLEIDPKRIFIGFHQLPGSHVGYCDGTYSNIPPC